MSGELLMTLGQRDVSGDNTSKNLFFGPSHVPVDRAGNIFVSDGYGNSRIVKSSNDGKFLQIIGGTKGKEPGQFNVAHAIVIDSKGRLIVSDLYNGRIQVFDHDGKLLKQCTSTDLGIKEPSGLFITADDTIWCGANEIDTFVKIKNGKVIERIEGIGGRPHVFTVDHDALYDPTSLTPAVKRVMKRRK
jgi:hypothetical protein